MIASCDALFALVPAVEEIRADAGENVDRQRDPEGGRVDILDLLPENGGADQIRHESKYSTGNIGGIIQFCTAEIHADNVAGQNTDGPYKKRDKETETQTRLTSVFSLIF